MPAQPPALEVLQVATLILVIIATVALAYKQARDLRRLEERVSKAKRYVTVIDCRGSARVREFREGDYVGAVVDECDGGSGVITAIYLQEPEEKRGGVKSPSSTRR